MAKLTKPIIAVNIDGTVRVLNQDPNATHFNWYTRELLSYNITSPSYDAIVAGTNESKIALPNSSYNNRVYITENYRNIRKFTSFKLYEAGETSGPSAVDVTELYVTKISDFEYSISIPNVEHDYIITWGAGAITYTITSSLTNCVADKSDESYVGGTVVNIVITAATGYTFDSSLGGTIGLSIGEVDKTSEYMTRSSDNKKVTIAIPATAAVGNIIYAAGAVEEIVQLTAPTIAMNTDGKTLEITDVENATSYDVYVDGALKTNVAKVIPKYKLTITGSFREKNGFPAGVYSALSFEGADSAGYLKFPKYLTTEVNEAYVEYKSTQSSAAIRKACPLVFENISKIYLFGGPIEINGTISDNYPTEYTLTQDTTIELGYRDD